MSEPLGMYSLAATRMMRSSELRIQLKETALSVD